MEYSYIRNEGKAHRMGQKLLAVVAEGKRGRIYLSPTESVERVAEEAHPTWRPDCEMPKKHRNFQPPVYGMENLGDIFTARQLVALTTFSDLVDEARACIHKDAVAVGIIDDVIGIDNGGLAARAYAEAVSVYLAITVNRLANRGCSISFWDNASQKIQQAFGRQALPMTWDFCESNPFSESSGNWLGQLDFPAKSIHAAPASTLGVVSQQDAQQQTISTGKVISTDPPYYDNIGYADLSDFFYVWLRRSLKPIYPNLFATLAVPKSEELVATPYRHGGKVQAEKFFLDGMTQAMQRLAEQAHRAYPVTIYYAFKQSDSDGEAGTSNNGWNTFLAAVFESGFAVSGTWPMRTELTGNLKKSVNALASSIVLVCRKRPSDAPSISRREFIRELNGVLPEALDEMTKGSGDERSPVAPVDLSQAIIGPGMAVFSKYAAVLEADGSPMSVRTALQLINRFLAGDDFDADTQFCLHWFEQHGWTESVFGEADVLARSKSTSVNAMKEAGVLQSGGGKVRLLKWAEYPTDWDPRTDTRTPVWEALHQLIRALKQGGESASGALLAALGGKAEAVRQLAYRLYTFCERLGQAEDARAYNELITSWTGIESAANSVTKPAVRQATLFES